MNQLVMRDKTQEYVFLFLGGALLLSNGIQLFIYNPREIVFWILFAAFFMAALLLLAIGFGGLINRITADAGILTIRWNTNIFKKHIWINKIAGITEDKKYIRILTKDGKSIRLRVKLMEPDKRRTIRKFLIENTGF